jgi:Tol biopolymer transport system component
MGPAGEHPRKLFETGEDSAIGGKAWSPDGKRILYPQINETGYTLISRDIETGLTNTIFPPSETRGINQFWWLTDGRLIYAKNETQAIGSISNMWAVRLDGHTGEPVEKPERLTNWTGFDIGSINATTDSRRLAFLQWGGFTQLYM